MHHHITGQIYFRQEVLAQYQIYFRILREGKGKRKRTEIQSFILGGLAPVSPKF